MSTQTLAERPPESELDHVPISGLTPSPENEDLYRRVHRGDPDVKSLADSIAERGMEQPLIITQDGWIVSGHRRHLAAQIAGLFEVPVIRLGKSRDDYTDDEFVTLLREHNRQRNKSVAEQLAEAMVDVSPDDAYDELLVSRRKQLEVPRERAVRAGLRKQRPQITKAKRELLEAMQTVVTRLREFWPLSDRAIHYRLLELKPLIHASKPDSVYVNDEKSYKACTELLTRARYAGLIPMEAIDDPTRPVVEWATHASPQAYLEEQAEKLFNDFYLDVQRSQPRHVELFVEKNTVVPILQPVAMQYVLPVTSCRGYVSTPAKSALVDRFERSGKKQLTLLVVSDADPEGEDIARNVAQSLRDDFNVSGVDCFKLALTPQQARERNLATDAKAKKTSSRHQGYVQKHGHDVWELEALEPSDLQAMVREGIEGVLDMELLNKERERERDHALEIKRIRDAAKVAIREACNL